MSRALTFREHFLMDALGRTLETLKSVLDERQCDGDMEVVCESTGLALCWYCSDLAEYKRAEAIYNAAQTSSETERYKVWVQIERIADDGTGETYGNIGLPDPLATRNTLAAAQAFVRTLPGWRPEGSDNRTPSP